MNLKIRYVYEDIDRHGNVRVYIRVPGRKIVRLRCEVGSPEFWEIYNATLAGEDSAPRRQATKPGSWRAVLQRYFASAEYKRLGKDTRRVRRQILDRVTEQHGDKPFARMEARHVRKLRDDNCDRPEAANAIVKAIRQVFTWALEAEVEGVSRNPAKDVPYLKGNGDGFHAWSVAEVRQFEDRHPIGTKARLALALLLFTGVRRGDVVRLGRQMEQVEEGMRWLVFTENKGQSRKAKHRELPILPELQEVIDRTPSGHLTYLVTEFGKPYSAPGFGNWFRRRCDEAGLPQCSAHGLRKAGATIAANNGATEHQLMSIFGWETAKQAGVYTRKANRKRLAKEGMHFLVPKAENKRGN